MPPAEGDLFGLEEFNRCSKGSEGEAFLFGVCAGRKRAALSRDTPLAFPWPGETFDGRGGCEDMSENELPLRPSLLPELESEALCFAIACAAGLGFRHLAKWSSAIVGGLLFVSEMLGTQPLCLSIVFAAVCVNDVRSWGTHW